VLDYGNMLEINATDDCQLGCSQCNRLCDVAPRRSYLSVDAIAKMCAEIPRMVRICIAGGEPMLHPDIEEVVRIIKEADEADEILLLTNGIEECDIKGVTIWNSAKHQSPAKHNYLMTVAPVDLNLFGRKDVGLCDMLKRCGLGYSADGYYPCPLSAAIGRVFGIRGAGTFDELMGDKYGILLEKTCSYCGYYLTSLEDSILPPFEYPAGMMTVSWVEAIEKYNGGNDAK